MNDDQVKVASAKKGIGGRQIAQLVMLIVLVVGSVFMVFVFLSGIWALYNKPPLTNQEFVTFKSSLVDCPLVLRDLERQLTTDKVAIDSGSASYYQRDCGSERYKNSQAEPKASAANRQARLLE